MMSFVHFQNSPKLSPFLSTVTPVKPTRKVKINPSQPTFKTERQYFDWIGSQLGIKELADWYKISGRSLLKRFGAKAIKQHNYSLWHALQHVYPEFKWDPWRFSVVPRSYWKDVSNCRQYFDWLGQQLGIRELSGWYKISAEEVKNQFGRKAFKHFNNSLSQALKTVYPDYNWQLWRFPQAPRNYWKDRENVKLYLESLVTDEQLKQNREHYLQTLLFEAKHTSKRRPILEHFRNHKKAFPEESNVEPRKLPSRGQMHLYRLVSKLFHQEPVYMEHILPQLRYSSSGRNMILDIFVPSLSLAFEYQGSQHYSTHYLYGTPREQRKKDEEKKEKCTQLGISLVEIPFWWDGQISSLVATIRRQRLDLLANVDSIK